MDQDKIQTNTSTRAARYNAGKALRETVSRESHADFTPDPHRDPLPILTASDSGRVASLVPERYKRMSVSPFTFYRGAAALMAHDLAAHRQVGALVQACGDCHLLNFGAFLTPENRVLFDINDFDETYPGADFTLDLKRLCASLAVAAQDSGLGDKKAQAIAQSAAKSYRTFMAELAEKSPLDVWRVSISLEDEVCRLEDQELETKVLAQLIKAEKSAKPANDFPDFTISQSGDMVIGDKPPTIFHVGADGEAVHTVLNDKALANYKATLLPDRRLLLDRYSLRDVAFKVVGVGSVGTYCAVGLFATPDNEPLILQLKQAWDSVIAPLASKQTSYANQGQRVVDGQRAMQAASDPFLGWTQDETGRQFYFRQLKNRRLGSLGELIESKSLAAYATLCGRTLARAHARTGDPVVIAGYLGKNSVMDEALAQFSMAYASQTVLDHAKLMASPLVPHEAAKTKTTA
ncbi:MAG: DUF2252 domain-containing protein [Beijerinckiaceae bacterium]|nr:DUF2252 domain-containing protein [Beijerinckiaceae bacterium]